MTSTTKSSVQLHATLNHIRKNTQITQQHINVQKNLNKLNQPNTKNALAKTRQPSQITFNGGIQVCWFQNV